MKPIYEAMIVAAAMIATALGARYAEAVGWLADGGERAGGVVIGILLMAVGNGLPKQTRVGECCVVDESYRARRFAGRVLIVAGLAHAGIWLFAPLDRANMGAMIVMVAALLLVMTRWLRPRSQA